MPTPADDDEPRWLDEDERTTWLRFAPLLTLLPLELERQLQRDSGLTLMEYHVLAGLSAAQDRTLRMSTIAKWTGGQLPRISQVTARMESRGWLVRRPDPEDGRSTLVSMTDEGFAVIEAAAPQHVANVRRLVLDPLTRSQAKQLGCISGRILDVIHPDSSDLPRVDG